MVTVNETNREPDGTFETLEASQLLNNDAASKLIRGRDEYNTTSRSVSLADATVTRTINGVDVEVLMVPYRLEEPYNVTVGTDQSDTTLVIPPHEASNIDSTKGSVQPVTIVGDYSNPTNHPIDSIICFGAKGAQTPKIAGLDIRGTEPYSNEDVAVSFYGSSHPSLDSCDLSNTTAANGILSYGSSISVEGGTDITDTGIALLSKHGGTINCVNGGIVGTTGYVTQARGGMISLNDLSDVTVNQTVNRRDAPVYATRDNTSQHVYGQYGAEGARIYLSSDYSYLSADGIDTIPLDTGDFDDLDIIDAANNQINVPSDGLYDIDISVSLSNVADNTDIVLRAVVNGTEIPWDRTTASPKFGRVILGKSENIKLTEGENIDLRIKADADLTVRGDFERTAMSLVRIG